MKIIESLSDCAAYIALGRSNTTPGACDLDTLAWALDATRAKVADEATEADCNRIVEWVRIGERAAR